MSGPEIFHCVCGARRPVSNGLRVVGCVQCGRAMSRHKSDTFSLVPSRWLLSSATFISQLLGILAFLMAATWMLELGHRNVGVITVALLGAVSVFAGGQAHRGSIGALGMCAGFDLAIGVVCLIRWSSVTKFVYAPTSWAAPEIARDLNLAMSITSLVALLTAVVCIVAVPQTRRYLAWHRTQMTLAPPTW
jgi:hypothetical protein